MDSVSRLTGRQRRRLLKFGLPRAVIHFVAALAAAMLFGFLLGYSQSARAIGYVNGTQTPHTEYKLCYTYSINPTKAGQTFCTQNAGKAGVCSAWLGYQSDDNTRDPNPAGTFGYYYTATNSMTASDPNCTGTITTTRNEKPANGCTVNCTVVTSSTVSSGYTNVTVYDSVCPANAQGDGAGNCICSNGFRPPASGGTTCSPYTCDAKPMGSDRVLENLTTKPSLCDGSPSCTQTYCDTPNNPYSAPTYGCAIVESLYAASQGPDGKWTARFVSAYSGATCMPYGASDQNSVAQPPSEGASAPTVDSSASQPQGTCAAGTCPGTYNGNSICVACSRTIGETVTTSVDKNASGVETGKTTIGTKADCIGNNCTITTTTSVNGSVTNVTTTTTDKDSLCKASPNQPACGGGGNGNGNGDGEGGGGSFSGTCSGGWTCGEGSDAITCAIATEQHKRDCEFWGEYTDAAKNLGTNAFANDYAGDASHPYKTANIRQESLADGFDQTDILTGSCPADRTIGTGAVAVSLPFSQLCTPASWLGTLLVGLTALACLGIVFKH